MYAEMESMSSVAGCDAHEREFFLVDRFGTYRIGESISLLSPHFDYNHLTAENREASPEVTATLSALFSSGISVHGQRYLLDRYPYAKDMVAVSPIIELTAELVRRWRFPGRPSRFESLFACETCEDARGFRMRHGQPYNRILRVSAQAHFRGDMNLLCLGPTIASSLNLLQKYWRGEASADPFWEILLSAPVHILGQVETPSDILREGNDAGDHSRGAGP